MNTQPKDQEPSMEEILSSIRRIIADEESEDTKPDDDRAVAADTEAGALETLEVLDDDDNDDDDDDGGDVLELTSVVEEGRPAAEPADVDDEPAEDLSSHAPLELVDDTVDDDDIDV
ncbi:MAG: hypothetical protein AAGC99_22045, partial [Pseudomonadota bacterium]